MLEVGGHGTGPVVGLDDLEALGTQAVGDGLVDRRVILDQEDLGSCAEPQEPRSRGRAGCAVWRSCEDPGRSHRSGMARGGAPLAPDPALR